MNMLSTLRRFFFSRISSLTESWNPLHYSPAIHSFSFIGRSLPLVMLLLCSAGAVAGDGFTSRDLLVTSRNDRARFLVRVTVDQPDCTYQEGETLQATVTSGRSGYLYLIYCNAAGKSYCVFPNKIQTENKITAGKPLSIPAPNSQFELTVGGPVFGREVLKAFVSEEPLTKDLPIEQLIASAAAPVKSETLKELIVTLRQRPALSWAEHSVEITTYAAGDHARAVRHRRVGLFIGVAKYLDKRIRNLNAPGADAQMMAEVMKKFGQLDFAIVLIYENATHENIEAAICKTLKDKTNPDDEVFIFWSGHGGRCTDDNDDEADDLDEYLVPYDGNTASLKDARRTMVMDDEFGRWIQELDGRRILVILDACFSGGQATGKGLGDAPIAKGKLLDFFDGEFLRAKDLGQKETALMASSRSTQFSYERREGDLSVMTYVLAKLIASGQEQISLQQAYEVLKVDVPKYMKKTFRRNDQAPVLVDHTSAPLYLRTQK